MYLSKLHIFIIQVGTTVQDSQIFPSYRSAINTQNKMLRKIHLNV